MLARACGAGARGRDCPRHLHELLGGDQGLHRTARRHRARLPTRKRPWSGPSGRRAGAVPAGPAPGPQHRGARPGARAGTAWSTTPPPTRRVERRAAQAREDDPVARALLGPRALHGRQRRRRARAHPRGQRARTSGMSPRGRPGRRRRRFDRAHHHHAGGRPAGQLLGHRHGAQPGAAAGPHAPGQADRVPGSHRLLLLDHEPHRPAAPGLDPGEPGRRPRREPDRG